MPAIPTSNNTNYNNPQQASKSANIVPVKGVLNVENIDSDDDSRSHRSSPNDRYKNQSSSRSPISPTLTESSKNDYFSSRSTTDKVSYHMKRLIRGKEI
jgi:hypothetical protein